MDTCYSFWEDLLETNIFGPNVVTRLERFGGCVFLESDFYLIGGVGMCGLFCGGLFLPGKRVDDKIVYWYIDSTMGLEFGSSDRIFAQIREN